MHCSHAFGYGAREWVERLKGADETDAAFLIRRFDSIDAVKPVKEKLYEDLDIPIKLSPGKDTPCRSREGWDAPMVFRDRPLDRSQVFILQCKLRLRRNIVRQPVRRDKLHHHRMRVPRPVERDRLREHTQLRTRE